MEKVEELFRQNPNLERLLRPDEHELEGLSESIQILRSARDADPDSRDVNFQLATTLISHSRKSFVEEGMRLMEALVYSKWQSNWSDVVQRHPVVPPGLQAAVARGVPISRATAPPPSDDDAEDEQTGTTSNSGSTPASSATKGTISQRVPSSSNVDGAMEEPVPAPVGSASEFSRDVVVSEDPTVMVSHRQSDDQVTLLTRPAVHVDEDASKVKPGRIDDLALYHYYLTLGWIKLKDLKRAEGCVEQMLLLAPGNKQGLALQTYIEVARRQGTASEVATAAGVGIVVAGLVTIAGALLRSRQSS